MTMFERIKFLADKQGKSINDVEMELGYSKNTLYRLKKNMPGSEKLQEIAEYFHVSTDYLLGRTENKYSGLSEEQRKLTVEEALKTAMGKDGKPIDEEDIPTLTRIIEAYLDGK